MPIAKKSDELALQDPATLPGELRRVGGSRCDDWNHVLVNQVVSALWRNNFDGEEIKKQQYAAVYALIGIGPKDELEGMLAAQLVACHNASMEYYRRAMLREKTLEARRENLGQANKLSRTYATLLESLNRHRGKGQQKVTVELFTYTKVDIRQAPRCLARTRRGSLCQSPAMPNGRCRMHGGKSPGASRGNKNALRHGRYTGEAIARRRYLAVLIRAARQLIG